MNNNLFDNFNHIYKIDIDGYLINKNNNKLDNNDTYISYMDMKQYIIDIKSSYKNLAKIYEQFNKDYYRQIIKLNNKEYDINEFMNILNNYNLINKYNDIMTYKSLIVLLCCQSSFALPYKLLTNIYNIDNDNYVLTMSKNKTEIKININNDIINIDLSTILLIKQIYTTRNTHKIILSISMEINTKSDKNEICIISWILDVLK